MTNGKMPQHIVVQISPNRWVVVQRSTDTLYVVCTKKLESWNRAKQVCDELNEVPCEDYSATTQDLLTDINEVRGYR